MAKTAREREATESPRKKKKSAHNGQEEAANSDIVDAVTSLLTDLSSEAVAALEGADAKALRKGLKKLLERVTTHLEEHPGELGKLLLEDLGDFGLDEGTLETALADERATVDQLEQDLQERQEAIEEEQLDLDELKSMREAREEEAAKNEQDKYNKVALRLFPVDDDRPIPTVYNSWNDEFLQDLALDLQPKVEALIKQAKGKKKKVK